MLYVAHGDLDLLMKSPIPMIGDVVIRGLGEAAALRRGDLDEIWQPLAGPWRQRQL
jgi:hypothetical protein